MVRQKSIDRLSMVKAGIVAHQANLTPRINLQQHDQEGNEVPAAFGRRYRMNDSASGIIYPAVHHDFGVLAGRRNFRLFAFETPQAVQGRKTMQFRFVLENQHLLGLVLYSVFFRRDSFLRALSQAASSRLPLRVCLGRRKENPS